MKTKLSMEREEIINLLQSGDFTIIYWDNGIASLYEKKWDRDKEYERDDYETLNKFLISEYADADGYCPDIVGLLTEALNGKSDSI